MQLIARFLEQCPAEQVEEMRFPCEPREYFAARCLRARKYSLADALQLVEATTAWRREAGIRALQGRESYDILGCLEDELQFFYQKSYFSCRDREGRPVYVERAGTVDVEAMFSAWPVRSLGLVGGSICARSAPLMLTPTTLSHAPALTSQCTLAWTTWWSTTRGKMRCRWCPCLRPPAGQQASQSPRCAPLWTWGA